MTESTNNFDFTALVACYSCKKIIKDLILCPKCKTVAYCSQSCLENNLNEHKKICNLSTSGGDLLSKNTHQNSTQMNKALTDFQSQNQELWNDRVIPILAFFQLNSALINKVLILNQNTPSDIQVKFLSEIKQGLGTSYNPIKELFKSKKKHQIGVLIIDKVWMFHYYNLSALII